MLSALIFNLTAGNGSTASWTYQYFEWVMQIFEQNSVSGGVCQFAYAALQEVDKIEGNFSLDSREASCAIHTIKGRLWSNIFKFSLEQKNFIESYCAIISNPDQESKYICLRRFLIVLCEQKAFEVIIPVA
jgi:nuclear pore complex protein Nup160